MPTTTTDKMTVTEFLAWADLPENRGTFFELLQGEVVQVPPPMEHHGTYCWLVIRALTLYLAVKPVGRLCTNDTGLFLSDDTLLAPDVMLLLDFPNLATMPQSHVRGVPALCVEVLSPSNRMSVMRGKVEQYQRRGVKLVWLIDPVARSVRVHQLNELPKELDETDTLTGNGVLPDFSCLVADLFRVPGAAQ